MLVLTILLTSGCVAQDVPTSALRPVQTLELPDVEGRIDHLAVDLEGRRLFVAAHGNNTVEVIDLREGRVVHTIEGLREPQGILYLPDLDRIVVTNGDGASATIFNAATYRLLKTVRLRADPDNVRFDARAGRAYVGEGIGRSGALAVLGVAESTREAEIPLAGHSESFQLETGGPRIFVNVTSAHHVAVVDRQRGAVTDTWSLEGDANFPMALDEAHHRLFVGTRRPSRLLVLDTETGKTVSTLASAGDADDIFYDEATRRLYVSEGAGAVTVIQQEDHDTYQRLGRVRTESGARTSLFVPAWHRLYLAVPEGGRRRAAVYVYTRRPLPIDLPPVTCGDRVAMPRFLARFS